LSRLKGFLSKDVITVPWSPEPFRRKREIIAPPNKRSHGAKPIQPEARTRLVLATANTRKRKRRPHPALHHDWRLCGDAAGRLASISWGYKCTGVETMRAVRNLFVFICGAKACLRRILRQLHVRRNETCDACGWCVRPGYAGGPSSPHPLRHPTRMTAIPVSRLFGRSAGLEMIWERVG
jgi:hypothetical protein